MAYAMTPKEAYKQHEQASVLAHELVRNPVRAEWARLLVQIGQYFPNGEYTDTAGTTFLVTGVGMTVSRIAHVVCTVLEGDMKGHSLFIPVTGSRGFLLPVKRKTGDVLRYTRASKDEDDENTLRI